MFHGHNMKLIGYDQWDQLIRIRVFCFESYYYHLNICLLTTVFHLTNLLRTADKLCIFL